MNKFELQVQNEAMFLGCILQDHTLIDEVTIQPNQFVNIYNRELFKSMLEIKKEGGEVSVYALQHLGESKAMQYGGTEYLEQVLQSVPSIHAFHTYQQNIINFHTVQEAQSVVNEFLNNTVETHNIKELTNLIQKVSNLEANTVKKQDTFRDIVQRRVEQHYDSPKSGLSGINTGYLSLNRYTDGWQRSDLIIVGARPSVGKTALVLDSIRNGCKKDKETFATFFSIEMAKEQIVDRLIAAEGRINVMKMRNPNKTFESSDWDRYSPAVGIIEKLPIDIRDENTVPEIRSVLRKNIKQNPDKKHVAAIDFLTLMKSVNPTGNTHTDITDVVKELKQVAKDLKVPIIVIAQLNRAVEARKEKRPSMSDLTESGSIEQIADVIMLLYRDDYYDRDAEIKGVTEINFAKNRQGKTGLVKMRFAKETNTFHDLV